MIVEKSFFNVVGYFKIISWKRDIWDHSSDKFRYLNTCLIMKSLANHTILYHVYVNETCWLVHVFVSLILLVAPKMANSFVIAIGLLISDQMVCISIAFENNSI